MEVHHAVTEDGYILELHRIPFGLKRESSTNGTTIRKPVFLQHGMMATDHVWLTGPSNVSLGAFKCYANEKKKKTIKVYNDFITAYLLADHGYDVWLGNSRGNTYSRKHLKLHADDDEFWNYS